MIMSEEVQNRLNRKPKGRKRDAKKPKRKKRVEEMWVQLTRWMLPAMRLRSK